ncbi:exodeoxyribonuclease VII large subunit [Ovoidimarina sediminis]|uniref:exodeoxyribonuclease VII large subunit n=1 Tax=Ovoidimarina sediminis TaxID=3079856 RepID=UPI00291468B6|nr:exodeoxyribonuclease VII large subunit [Rhodophyticola sp. MJ-SS7]MDU8942891.1 exodeoxyribonuclease VII large subunit [Rhodophyticola sp. MJ-SS7]
MSDLIDDPSPGQNAHEYSVSEISGAVKRVIEGEFGRVRVKGEVGRVFVARSGHLYFDLKDDRSVLAAVSWKGQVAALSVRPEEGMEVVATGRLTTFGSQSKYQLNVDDVQVAGVGALMAMLEQRKKKLAAEGLFDEGRKRPLPYLPEIIGVVTSPSGAVIRDILHRLRDRFPRKVLVWPVAVQGQAAAGEVARAIEGFNRLSPGGALPRPDVLIVARGGGSIEDLWAFNEEIVARAAAASDIPLISAVGHETDTTLIDYVSDQRAPTPTAAAEMAVPVRLDLLGWVDQQGARLSSRMAERIETRGQRLRDLARGLPRLETLLDGPKQRLDMAESGLKAGLRSLVQDRRAALTRAAANLSPALLSARTEARRATLQARGDRLAPALRRATADRRRAFAELDAGLRRTLQDRRRRLAETDQRLSEAWARAGAAAARGRERKRETLVALDRIRLSLGYEQTLARGYALVWDGTALVTTAAAAEAAQNLEIQFQDGRMRPGPGAPPRRKAKDEPEEPGDQGSLF